MGSPGSSRRPAALLSLSVLLAAAGCPKPIVRARTSLSPSVITLGKIAAEGIKPQNCDAVVAGWPTPLGWWNGLLPNQPPKVVGEAAVGFEFLMHEANGCASFRQDLYRAGFAYDLSQHQALKGLVRKAELTFSSAVLPSGASRTGMCPLVTAGGGSLLVVAPGAALPAAPGGFADLGSGPSGQSFPAGGKAFAMSSPWIAGPITAGVQTGVAVTTQATGLGGASFSVDVTSYVNGSLERGDSTLAFMLSGSDEAPRTVSPPDPIDCKTTYRIGELVIEHL